MDKPTGPAAASRGPATAPRPASQSATDAHQGDHPNPKGFGARVGSDLGPRLLSGVVLAAVAIGAVRAGPIPLAVVLALIGGIIAWEWGRMVRGTTIDAAMSAHIATVVACIVLMVFGLAGPALLGVVIGTILTGLLSFGRHSVLSSVGVLFAVLPGIALLWFRIDRPHGATAVFFILAAVIATDVGAYFCGRLIGGPRLWPRVSPNKTWSGLAGGVTAAALAAASFALLAPGAVPLHLAITGGLLALTAQGGDLAESALKRHFGTKDTSALIPGHGGFMDRVDGLATASIASATAAVFLDITAPARALLLW